MPIDALRLSPKFCVASVFVIDVSDFFQCSVTVVTARSDHFGVIWSSLTGN